MRMLNLIQATKSDTLTLPPPSHLILILSLPILATCWLRPILAGRRKAACESSLPPLLARLLP